MKLFSYENFDVINDEYANMKSEEGNMLMLIFLIYQENCHFSLIKMRTCTFFAWEENSRLATKKKEKSGGGNVDKFEKNLVLNLFNYFLTTWVRIHKTSYANL